MRKKITMKYKKERMYLFTPELEILINEIIDFNNVNDEDFGLFYNDNFWRFHKISLEAHNQEPLIEVRVTKSNYNKLDDLPSGTRIKEACWVYLKEKNEHNDKKVD